MFLIASFGKTLITMNQTSQQRLGKNPRKKKLKLGQN
jgi:hypothetical protein